MAEITANGYTFKYLDKNDIERIRQKVLDRRQQERQNILWKQMPSSQMQFQQKIDDSEMMSTNHELSTIGDSYNSDDNIKEAYANHLHESQENNQKDKPFLAVAEQPTDITISQANIADIKVPNPGINRHEYDINALSPSDDFIKLNISESPENDNKTVSRNTIIESNEIVFTRITSFQQAIEASLDKIVPKLLQSRYCDGQLDYRKYKKRFSDYSKVFSRNYLYQIERSISDIQLMGSSLPNHEFSTKVCSLYNLIYLAISSYLRNLSNYVDHGVPDKLIKFLTYIQNGTNLCIQKRYFDKKDWIVMSLLRKVEILLEQLNKLVALNEIEGKIDNFDNIAKKIDVTPRKIDKLAMYSSRSQTKSAKTKPPSKKKTKSIGTILVRKVLRCDGDKAAPNKHIQNQQQHKQQLDQANLHQYDHFVANQCLQINAERRQSKTKAMTTSSCNSCERQIRNKHKIDQCKTVVINKDDLNATTDANFVMHDRVSNKANGTTIDDLAFNNINMLTEKEIFRSKNVRMTQIISARTRENEEIEKDTQLLDPIGSNLNVKNYGQTAKQRENETVKEKVQKKNDLRAKEDVFKKIEKVSNYGRKYFPFKIISRLSDEIHYDDLPMFNKSVDLGERTFIEQFLALELNK